MTTQTTAKPAADERAMTHGDRAHLLRAIAHAITDGRLPGPMGVDLHPEFGSAILRFDNDDITAVDAWAALIGATVVHSGYTYDEDSSRVWHEYGSRPRGGERGLWHGWRIELWCVAFCPSPAAESEAGA